MYRASLSQSHSWKKVLRSLLVTAWLLEFPSIFGCFQGSQIRDDNTSSSSKIRPIDVDTSIAEKIGQEALAKVGYDEIIKLSFAAGYIDREMKIDVQLASYDTSVAANFAPVFSRYALAAAVTSQADSPLPGPADIAAVGVLVIGLVDAGLLDGHLLKSIGELLFATGAATETATATTNAPVDRSDCIAHLKRCMETSATRGRRGSGSHPGQSICADCFDQCNGYRRWPDKTDGGKDCQWWDGR